MEEEPSSNPTEPTTRILAFSMQTKSPSSKGRTIYNVQTMKKSSVEEHHQLPQARQSKASYHRVENVSDEMKEQAEALTLMHGESSKDWTREAKEAWEIIFLLFSITKK